VPAPFTASAPSPKVAFDYLLNFVEIWSDTATELRCRIFKGAGTHLSSSVLSQNSSCEKVQKSSKVQVPTSAHQFCRISSCEKVQKSSKVQPPTSAHQFCFENELTWVSTPYHKFDSDHVLNLLKRHRLQNVHFFVKIQHWFISYMITSR
jgi:hypothetical protein